jgi:hypothetical protein
MDIVATDIVTPFSHVSDAGWVESAGGPQGLRLLPQGGNPGRRQEAGATDPIVF